MIVSQVASESIRKISETEDSNENKNEVCNVFKQIQMY
jgi:hypothetical protein